MRTDHAVTRMSSEWVAMTLIVDRQTPVKTLPSPCGRQKSVFDVNEGDIIMLFQCKRQSNEPPREVPSVFEYVTTCYLVTNHVMALKPRSQLNRVFLQQK